MKTIEETRKEIRSTEARLDEVSKRLKTATEEKSRMQSEAPQTLADLRAVFDSDAYRLQEKIIAESLNERERLKVKHAVEKDNLRALLAESVLPTVKEELMKYAGKSLGKATKEKIINALEEKTNCFVYLRRTCTTDQVKSIEMRTRDVYRIDFELNFTGNNYLTDFGNKVSPEGIKGLEDQVHKNICDDVDDRVNELFTRMEKIKQAFDDLRKAQNAFNEVCTPSIEQAYYPYARTDIKVRD